MDTKTVLLEAWTAKLTEAPVGREFLCHKYREICSHVALNRKEPHNAVAGTLWYILSQIYHQTSPAVRRRLGLENRLTQAQFARVTDCSVSSFANISYELQRTRSTSIQ